MSVDVIVVLKNLKLSRKFTILIFNKVTSYKVRIHISLGGCNCMEWIAIERSSFCSIQPHIKTLKRKTLNEYIIASTRNKYHKSHSDKGHMLLPTMDCYEFTGFKLINLYLNE